MNEQKPIYIVKSRNGQTVTQGDFSSIVNWLRENRIKNDDDLRRDGLHVLEKDELWGRVSDFPEFNFSERQGRRALYRARVRANVWLLICGFIFLLGVGLICYDQVIPRYTEAQRVDEAVELARKSKEAEALATQKADAAEAEAEAKAKKKIEDSQKASNIKFKALEEKNSEEQSKLNQEIVALRGSMGDDSKTRKEAQKEIASLKSRIKELMDESAQLKLEILKFEQDHPLYHPEKKR